MRRIHSLAWVKAQPPSVRLPGMKWLSGVVRMGAELEEWRIIVRGEEGRVAGVCWCDYPNITHAVLASLISRANVLAASRWLPGSTCA